MIRWRLLTNIIPAAVALTNSQQSVVDRDYQGALEKLRSLALRLCLDFPATKLPLRANLLGMQSAYFLNDAALCEACAKVVTEMTLGTARRKDGPRIRYTADYVFRFLEHCAGRFEERADVFLTLAAEVEAVCGPYEISAVPKFMLQQMPMQEHELHT